MAGFTEALDDLRRQKESWRREIEAGLLPAQHSWISDLLPAFDAAAAETSHALRRGECAAAVRWLIVAISTLEQVGCRMANEAEWSRISEIHRTLQEIWGAGVLEDSKALAPFRRLLAAVALKIEKRAWDDCVVELRWLGSQIAHWRLPVQLDHLAIRESIARFAPEERFDRLAVIDELIARGFGRCGEALLVEIETTSARAWRLEIDPGKLDLSVVSRNLQQARSAATQLSRWLNRTEERSGWPA